MLRNLSFDQAILTNVVLAAIWHFATYFLCISVDTRFFDASKKIYQPKKWENGGKIYNDVFKINRWKDLLPQYVGKDGFSKSHLTDLSVEYLDEFIMETCRGEWNHTMNCMFAVVIVAMNGFFMTIILLLLLFIGNLPFVIIQRYNRFRLQKLRKIIIKKNRKKEEPSLGFSDNKIRER